MYKKLEGMSLTQVTKEDADQTRGHYYYLVTIGSTPCTAFCTKYGFLRWLNARGLKVTRPLVPKGEFQHQRLEGHCYEIGSSIDDFRALADQRRRKADLYTLHNARYLPAYLHTEADGAVTVTFPWSGLGDEPGINYWHGVAIERGVCYRTSPEEGIPGWVTCSPEEVVARANSMVPSDLSEIEKAMVASSWLSLADQDTETPPLKHPEIVTEMIFQ